MGALRGNSSLRAGGSSCRRAVCTARLCRDILPCPCLRGGGGGGGAGRAAIHPGGRAGSSGGLTGKPVWG